MDYSKISYTANFTIFTKCLGWLSLRLGILSRIEKYDLSKVSIKCNF